MKKHTFFLLVAATLASSASMSCSKFDIQEFPVDLHIDSRFDDQEVESIVEAVDEWQEVSGEVIKVNLILGFETSCSDDDVSDNDSDDIKVVYRCHRSDSYIVSEKAEIALGTGNFHHITLEPDNIIEYGKFNTIKPTLLHEFGHFVGLEHAPATINLMNPLSGAWDGCIDDQTVKRFCNLYGTCDGYQRADCDGKNK